MTFGVVSAVSVCTVASKRSANHDAMATARSERGDPSSGTMKAEGTTSAGAEMDEQAMVERRTHRSRSFGQRLGGTFSVA